MNTINYHEKVFKMNSMFEIISPGHKLTYTSVASLALNLPEGTLYLPSLPLYASYASIVQSQLILLR